MGVPNTIVKIISKSGDVVDFDIGKISNSVIATIIDVENTNRWIRRYIPKSSDISRYSKRFIKNLEAKINRRIMKTLNYYRPEELLKQYRKRKQRLRAVEKLNI